MSNLSPSKKEGSFLFSTSLLFDENIDKLWLFLKDLSLETKILDFLDNFKLIKGENSWTAGNMFSIYWVGVSNIEVKCISTYVTRMKKKIKWKFKCEIGISYYKTMTLYRITNDDKTLVKFVFTRCEKNKYVDPGPQMNYYANLQYEILVEQSKYLQNLKKDRKVYQSCIIDKNHVKIWNFIINLKNLEKLCPDFIKNIEYKGEYNEIGSFFKFYQCQLKKTFFFKITNIITPIKKKTYSCQFEAVGTELKNIPIIIEIQVVIISENKTYISVLYKFENKSDVDIVNIFENNLKDLFNKLRQYIKENEKEFSVI
jgi:hypothetical protein